MVLLHEKIGCSKRSQNGPCQRKAMLQSIFRGFVVEIGKRHPRQDAISCTCGTPYRQRKRMDQVTLRFKDCECSPLSKCNDHIAGAGDGVLAGMALAYLHHESPEYGLQHGFALAGAVLGTLATADFLVEEYQRLLPLIQISPIAV